MRTRQQLWRGVTVVVVLGLVVGPVSASLGGTGAATAAQTGSTYVRGQVLSPNGQAVSDATVTVPTKDGRIVATTNGAGEFRLNLRGEQVAPRVLVVVQKEGFVSSSTAVTVGEDSESLDITLLQEGEQLYEVFRPTVHIGDDYIEPGDINGALSEEVDGSTFEAGVTVGQPQTMAESAALFFVLQGAEVEHTVYLNGEPIGRIGPSDPDGSTSTHELLFNEERLRAGANTVRIESVDDNFEISNVRLRLRGVPADTTNPTITVDGPETADVGTSPSMTVTADDGENVVQHLLVTLWNGDEQVVTQLSTDGTVRLSERLDAEGTYTLSIQATDAAGNLATMTSTITVRAPTPTATPTATATPSPTPSPTPTPTPEPPETIPGFGPVVAVVAFLVVALLARRR
jgi:PGF-CTERM protein